MPKVPVPVLWNEESNFMDNAIVSVDSSSQVVGITAKPTAVFPPATQWPTLQNVLQIKEPNFGALYLNMTLAAYQAAIRAASGSPAPIVVTKIFDITTTTTTITDASFAGATLIAVWKDGVDLDITGMLSGTTLTFGSSLVDGDKVGVIYYTA